ncbi:MAG: hypothetical protein R2831_11055 [Chitinophagaceae bacterium]
MNIRTLSVLVFLAPFTLLAQQRKYVNEFLSIGVGARGIGMSGAQVASIQNVNAAFWNPAGLSQIQSDLQIGLMHSEYFSSIAKYDYLGTAFPLQNKKGVLGISVIRFAIDDIPYTINLIQPDGSIDYSKIKSISAADYAGLISYAQPLRLKMFEGREDINMHIGGNLKIIHRSVGSLANAWGTGIDLGLQGNIKKWRVGLMARDITTTQTVWSFSFTEKEKEEFAKTGNEIVSRSTEVNTPRLILGLGRKIPIQFADSSKDAYLLAETNLDITSDGKRYGNLINLSPFSIDPRVGLEFGYNNKIYIRGGVGNFQRITKNDDTTGTKKRLLFQPTLGAGFKWKQINIDYAFSSLNIQGNPLYSHFISLTLDINKKNSYGSNRDVDNKAAEINKSIRKKRKNY